jgi:predicted MFS family arabinose efflux permease
MSRRERLFLPAISLVRFSSHLPGILTGLLLIEMAASFGTNVGVMGQIRTVSSGVSVVACLLVGVMCVWFGHKLLFVVGLGLLSASAYLCYIASSFEFMLVAFSLSGVGMAFVGPIGMVLIAKRVPQDRRVSAVGWTMAAAALAYLVGAPAFAFIAGIGGWRLAFLGFVLPFSLLSLVSSYVVLPSEAKGEGNPSSGGVVDALKAVGTNLSASACMVTTALVIATWSVHLIYSPSFLRQSFGLSRGFVSLSTIVGASSYIVGSVLSGRVVNRYGRRGVALLVSVPAGLMLLLYYNMPNLWVTLGLSYGACVLFGMLHSANTNLSLEQIPAFRGTMMSINQAAGNLGSTLVVMLGGWALLEYGYRYLGALIAVLNLLAFVVYRLMVKDPLSDLGTGD